MRLGLEIDGDIVRLELLCDSEEQADRHFEVLAEQLRSGIINFTVTEVGGTPPTLETVQ